MIDRKGAKRSSSSNRRGGVAEACSLSHYRVDDLAIVILYVHLFSFVVKGTVCIRSLVTKYPQSHVVGLSLAIPTL